MGDTYKPVNPFLAERAAYQASVSVSRLEPSPSSGAAAGGASSSLEECTLERGPHYAVTLKQFGDGLVTCQGVFHETGWRGRNRSQRLVDDSKVVHSSILRERSEFSLRRARRTLRERAWMLRVDRLLTLTKRNKFSDRDEAWLCWKSFTGHARRFWGRKFQFIVVIEPHQIGGYHLHVALSGYFDVGILRRLWMKALGGKGNESGSKSPGNVDISGAVSSPRSRTRIASYIAKYLGKDVDALFRSRRSFASSGGIPAPRIVRWTQAVYSATDPIAVAMRRLRDVVSPDARGRGGRLVALQWWRFQFGGVHGFTITPF